MTTEQTSISNQGCKKIITLHYLDHSFLFDYLSDLGTVLETKNLLDEIFSSYALFGLEGMTMSDERAGVFQSLELSLQRVIDTVAQHNLTNE